MRKAIGGETTEPNMQNGTKKLRKEESEEHGLG